jgi:putative transcriptional regulator
MHLKVYFLVWLGIVKRPIFRLLDEFTLVRNSRIQNPELNPLTPNHLRHAPLVASIWPRWTPPPRRKFANINAWTPCQAKADGAAYVRGIRERLGFSQPDFALRINVPLDTLRNWEQGKRKPTGAASALLKILDKAPQAALKALG